MNHNIQNKITEEYIQQRIQEHIQEHDDKIYLYYRYSTDDKILYYNSPKDFAPRIGHVIANNERNLLIKIFDDIDGYADQSPLIHFLARNFEKGNTIIKEYFISCLQKEENYTKSRDEYDEILDIDWVYEHMFGAVNSKKYAQNIANGKLFKCSPERRKEFISIVSRNKFCAPLDEWPEFREKHSELDDLIYQYMLKDYEEDSLMVLYIQKLI